MRIAVGARAVGGELDGVGPADDRNLGAQEIAAGLGKAAASRRGADRPDAERDGYVQRIATRKCRRLSGSYRSRPPSPTGSCQPGAPLMPRDTADAERPRGLLREEMEVVAANVANEAFRQASLAGLGRRRRRRSRGRRVGARKCDRREAGAIERPRRERALRPRRTGRDSGGNRRDPHRQNDPFHDRSPERRRPPAPAFPARVATARHVDWLSQDLAHGPRAATCCPRPT